MSSLSSVDAVLALRREIGRIRRHHSTTMVLMIAITVITAGVIQFALALQQISTRMSALGAEEATLIARVDDLVYALKQKATEPSAGEQTLSIIRDEISQGIGRIDAINDEIAALDRETWFGIAIGGHAAEFYEAEPYLIFQRSAEKIAEIRALLAMDRNGLQRAYLTEINGGPLVRKMPVTVGIELALKAFQDRASSQSRLLGKLQLFLSALLIALLIGDAFLVFRKLIDRLRESHQRVHHAQLELDRLAHQDPLTGIANRARFTGALADQLALSVAQGTPFAMLQLDLNRFKAINDTLGHAAGDAVLIAVARALTSVMRSQDVVARLGGDEYAVICPGLSNARDFETLARAMHAAISQPVAFGAETLIPSASIGCAVFPEHGSDAASLVHHADTAMYLAKQKPERFHFFEEAMAAAEQRQKRLENDLDRALEGGDFGLSYRPVIEPKGRRIVSIEVECTWVHPLYGPLALSDYATAIEKSGRVLAYAEAMVTALADDAGRLFREAGPDLFATLRLPVAAIADPGFPSLVSRVFARRSVPLNRLGILVAEGALYERGGDRLRDALKVLASTGLSVVLDDFGERNASMLDLSRLPLTAIRLGPALVPQQVPSGSAATLLPLVVSFASGLGLPVHCPRVTELLLLQQVEAAGLAWVSGDLLSRPLSAEGVAALILASRATHQSGQPDARPIRAEEDRRRAVPG